MNDMISILSIYEDMLNAEVIGVNPAVILLLVIIILILIDIIFLLTMKDKYTVRFKNRKLVEYIDKALKKDDTDPTIYN